MKKRFKTERCLRKRWDPKRNLIMSKGYETMKDPIMIKSKETKKSIGVLREIQQRYPIVIQN